jgi:hypothetical protein
MRTIETLQAFDAYLAARGLRLDAVIIGGAALNLLGVVARPTKDCDVLYPEIPVEVAAAAREFAVEVRRRGEVLHDRWFNNGPGSLVGQLPSGWMDRLQPAFRGVALELRCLGRPDLLRSKLFALCDRGVDLGDCLALAPTPEELAEIGPWVEAQDGSPDWPAHVRDTLADLTRRIGGGV